VGIKASYSSFERTISRISRFLNGIGAGILVLMVLMVVVDVSLRFFFNRPVEGSYEIVEFMMAVVVCLGMAYCGVKQGHTAVEFLVERFSERTQAIIDCFNYLVCTLLFVLICWKSISQAGVLKEGESISTVLEVPLYPFLWILGICSGMLGLVFLLHFVNSVMRVTDK
jgi:TRAP-type C4-dicarboxylate transport system permease small subunit